jgi:NTP pyrophosphatase (non-canonical NTP hydrolase)
MTFAEIEKLVIKWGSERDLYNNSSATLQAIKLQEELNELIDALSKSSLPKVIDAVGDMLVVLTHISIFIGSDLTTCYLSAYDEIKERKGKMVNGIFVKEL